jgi:hypothetical protein
MFGGCSERQLDDSLMNGKSLKGDQAGVCGAISPVRHEKQQLELFLNSI